jgi:hypothetical protein
MIEQHASVLVNLGIYQKLYYLTFQILNSIIFQEVVMMLHC